MRKITGKIGLMFSKLTFYVGKQANYLQLYLNDTSKLKKCEKVLNSESSIGRTENSYCSFVGVLKNFTIFH